MTVPSPADPARVRAAESVRRLGHALHAHDVDEATLTRIADAAESVIATIDATPVRLRDEAALRRQMWHEAVPDGAVIDHFEDCFVTGRENALGIGVEVVREGEEAVGRVVLGPAFEGAPGRAHGGVVAAIFDDVLGCLLNIRETPAYTGELTVRYLAATPIGVPLTFRAWVQDVEGRKLDIVGDAHAGPEGGEQVHVATGRGRFIAITH